MVFNLVPTHRMVLGLCISLCSLAFITLCTDLYQWHADWQLVHTATNSTDTNAAHNKAALLMAELPESHLFGKSLTKDGEVPLSSLQFAITGIVKSGNANTESKVYISVANQPSKIYQVGDNLPYGVKVYDINGDSVILENGGHLEKLSLTRERLQFKPRGQEFA